MRKEKKASGFFIWAMMVALCCPLWLTAYEILDPPKPTHTEKGVPHAKLKLIKEISPDFDEKLFLAQPVAIAVGDQNRFYVYDKKLWKVLIFDGKFSCIAQFLNHGRGPGETDQNSNIGMDLGLDGNFYLSDSLGDKIIQFSQLGKYQADFRLYRSRISPLPYRPVVDKAGYLYTYSINNGIVDKMNLKTRKLVHTYLDVKMNGKFIIYKPDISDANLKASRPDRYFQPHYMNTTYDITNDGKLFIYLGRSSTVFIFNGDKLERKFDILIDRVMMTYKKRMEDAIKARQKRKPKIKVSFNSLMFYPCVLDKDEPYFYLQENGFGCQLYKFDFSGKLICIIGGVGTSDSLGVNIYAKKKGIFYGLSIEDRNPMILKKEEQ